MLTFSFTQEIVLIAYNLAQDRQVLLLSWNLYSSGVRQTIKINYEFIKSYSKDKTR